MTLVGKPKVVEPIKVLQFREEPIDDKCLWLYDIERHELVVGSVDANLRYGAITHCWGPDIDWVHLDGVEEKIPFPRQENTLIDILEQASSTNNIRYWWWDIISIPQRPNQQHVKASEVPKMQMVYSRAEICLLLPHKPLDLSSFSRLQELRQALDSSDEFPVSECVIVAKGLEALMDLAWWNRVWTLQEWILPGKLLVRCGPQTCRLLASDDHSGDLDFLYQSWCLLKIRTRNANFYTMRSLVKYLDCFTTFATHYELRLEMRAIMKSGKSVDFGRLISVTGSRLCSRPYDRWYGLLGLVNWGSTCVLDFSSDLEAAGHSVFKAAANAGDFSWVAATGHYCNLPLMSWMPMRSIESSNLFHLVHGLKLLSTPEQDRKGPIRLLTKRLTQKFCLPASHSSVVKRNAFAYVARCIVKTLEQIEPNVPILTKIERWLQSKTKLVNSDIPTFANHTLNCAKWAESLEWMDFVGDVVETVYRVSSEREYVRCLQMEMVLMRAIGMSGFYILKGPVFVYGLCSNSSDNGSVEDCGFVIITEQEMRVSGCKDPNAVKWHVVGMDKFLAIVFAVFESTERSIQAFETTVIPTQKLTTRLISTPSNFEKSFPLVVV